MSLPVFSANPPAQERGRALSVAWMDWGSEDVEVLVALARRRELAQQPLP
jgi:hypothetical protein